MTPKNAEPHLWLGDSLRLSGKPADAEAEYQQYLSLSDFDSKLAGQLNYYVSRFAVRHAARNTAPAQHDIWKDLRSLAYFGLCDCERRLKQYDAAIGYCQKSLTYYTKDPVRPLCSRPCLHAQGQ